MFFQKHILLQIIAIFPVIAGYLLAGLGCGWLAPTLQRYKNSDSDFSLDTQACSLIASLHYAGRSVACLFLASLVHRLGRNKLVALNSVCACAVWLSVLSTKSIPLHYAIRLLFGTGTASLDVAGALYIGENSSPHLRGIFGSMCSLAFYLGELIAFVVGTYCSYETTAILFACISFSVLLTTVILLREPAQQLLLRGHPQAAENRFFELRGMSDSSRQEFDQMKESLGRSPEPFTFSLLASRSMRAVCVVNCYAYLAGYAPINGMSSMAFASVRSLKPNELTILLGVLQLVSIFFSSTVVERVGRRPLLLVSAVACTCIHLSIAALYHSHDVHFAIPHSAWILFAFIAAYAVMAAAVVIPLMTTIRGELLSPQLKALGGSAAMFCNSAVSIASAGLFLPVAEAFGMKANFLWFAAMSFCVLVYIYVDLPETRGLTLTQIQLSLGEKTKQPKRARTGCPPEE